MNLSGKKSSEHTIHIKLNQLNSNEMDLQKLRDWFDSEEGIKHITDIKNKNKVEARQLERLYESGCFEKLTEKAIEKYNSSEYRDRWYNRGIVPPEDLLFFLFDYAKKYGRECSEEEWIKHGNSFSSGLFFCNGYYFNMMNGQGSAIIVTKCSI